MPKWPETLAEALKLWLRTDPTVFVPLLPEDQVSVTLSSSLVLHSVGVESSWTRGVMAVEPCACSCGRGTSSCSTPATA